MKIETNDVSLDEKEEELTDKLKNICDQDGTELFPTKSAAIFHQMAKIYQKKRPEQITHRMICLIQSASLFNAALARSPDNAQDIENDLKDLCSEILDEASAKFKCADLVKQAKIVAQSIEKMRSTVTKKLQDLDEIPNNLSADFKEIFEAHRAKDVENLLNSISNEYTNIMIDVANFTEKVMGEPPCSFSLAGMGSLARKEITPYSDFENMILMKTNHGCYEDMLNYFRWFSVLFQIVLINLKETIIPSVFISSLNDKNSKHGNWYRDNVTTRGICFDGMMPHACKFPLGRQQLTKDKPWATELIKPVNEMLKYLNSEESLKNGYHLSTILTKTCHVYGNADLFEEFKAGVRHLIEQESQTVIQESVAKQITEDLENFATRQSLASIKPTVQFNLKRVVYRSTTILVSELGRLHKIHVNSCFEILRKLAKKNHISKNARHKVMFAIALACEVRLKWYMKNHRQHDNIDSIDTFAGLVGKQATLQYFQIAYALQCDISKRLNLIQNYLYSNPILLNISLMYTLNDFSQLQHVLRIAKEDSKASKRYFDFDECFTNMNRHAALEIGKIELHLNQKDKADQTRANADALLSLGIFFARIELL